jgi:hypothetical protein
MHRSGVSRRENAKVYPAVIARLDRAIQYSTDDDKSRSCGVLDTPLAAFAKAPACLAPNPGEVLAETDRGV